MLGHDGMQETTHAGAVPLAEVHLEDGPPED